MKGAVSTHSARHEFLVEAHNGLPARMGRQLQCLVHWLGMAH
jgi:hypothetical protein